MDGAVREFTPCAHCASMRSCSACVADQRYRPPFHSAPRPPYPLPLLACSSRRPEGVEPSPAPAPQPRRAVGRPAGDLPHPTTLRAGPVTLHTPPCLPGAAYPHPPHVTSPLTCHPTLSKNNTFVFTSTAPPGNGLVRTGLAERNVLLAPAVSRDVILVVNVPRLPVTRVAARN